ncbi:MAG: type III secretion system export apparatus subunit SctR [Proteobacteria bacterium]|nr:type III secretion system export apparatus subunit SctR [Pseudomonadota bacterium]
MTELGNPATLIALLVGAALLPFLAVLVTSYIKLVVVLGLIRNALGVQSIPPNMALNAIAIILSAYIMQPVFQNAYLAVKDRTLDMSNPQAIAETVQAGAEPFRLFLEKHTGERERTFFVDTTKELWSEQDAAGVTDRDFMVLIPAFTTSELTSAFKLGFLLFLPFIVVDLVVSNILLAMGMMMVSPMTISLPFKLFLFVTVNGWERLIHGLVLSYAGHGG